MTVTTAPTQISATPEPGTSPGNRPARLINCLEVWGGNDAIEQDVDLPQLKVWVNAQPYHGAALGGDLYFLSSCMNGRIVRFALADVAGHGQTVDEHARTLRKLLRRNIGRLDQSRIARILSRQFAAATEEGQFATALLMSYHEPSGNLIVCNAGHPRALWYSTRHRSWELLTEEATGVIREQMPGASNLPLGVIDSTSYMQFAVPLGQNDLLVLYTDAMIEASGPDGRQLGEAGLLNLVQRETEAKPELLRNPRALGRMIIERLDTHRQHVQANDDQTLLVVQHHGGEVERPTLPRRIGAFVCWLMGMVRPEK